MSCPARRGPALPRRAPVPLPSHTPHAPPGRSGAGRAQEIIHSHRDNGTKLHQPTPSPATAASLHLKQSPRGPTALGRCGTAGPDFCHPSAPHFPRQMGCSETQLLVPFPAIRDNTHEEDALAGMPVHSVSLPYGITGLQERSRPGTDQVAHFWNRSNLDLPCFNQGEEEKERANNKDSLRKPRLQPHFLSSNII